MKRPTKSAPTARKAASSGTNMVSTSATTKDASAGKKKKKAIWISWDLGLRGDYEGLWTWLANNSAKECGDSTAVVISTRFDKQDIPELIKSELAQVVKFSPKDRIYIVHLDDETGFNKGKFLFGSRKRNPWEGYSSESHMDIEDSVE